MTAREGDGETWLANPSDSSDGPSGLGSAAGTPTIESVADVSRFGSAQAAAPAQSNNGAPAASPVVLPVDLPTLLRDLENQYIEAALLRTQRNKKEAAKLLGMGRTTLVEKLRRRGRLASSA